MQLNPNLYFFDSIPDKLTYTPDSETYPTGGGLSYPFAARVIKYPPPPILSVPTAGKGKKRKDYFAAPGFIPGVSTTPGMFAVYVDPKNPPPPPTPGYFAGDEVPAPSSNFNFLVWAGLAFFIYYKFLR